jgi:hypothetical protein
MKNGLLVDAVSFIRRSQARTRQRVCGHGGLGGSVGVLLLNFSDDPANRPGARKPIGCDVEPSRARSARMAPTTLANLKPCPEKPAAIATRDCSGWSPRRKWASGVIV